MNKELPKPQPSEEVDLGQLFKLIGNAFNRIFNFIGNIFKSILSICVFLLKTLIDNYKLIGITMFIAFALGVLAKKLLPPVYTSQMIVKPYFDSKFQLVTNLYYYNALINEKDFDQLNKIFDIDTEASKSIVKFEIKPGPETENDRRLQFEDFIQNVDSVRRKEIKYKDFIEDRSIYSGEIFEIKVKSQKKDIFRSLEAGLNSTFSNTYSKKKMQKRDSIIIIEKQRILGSIKQVDSLKNVYINVLEEESKSDGSNMRISVPSKDGMLIQERTKTKEYELLEKQIALRQELSTLEAQKVEEDVFFDTISSFQDVGSKDDSFFKRYPIIFPIISFLLLSLIFFFKIVLKYVKNYEG